jgi:hypothetical protein
MKRRLYLDLWRLLIKRVEAENAATRAAALMEDMGYDDCPICVANRRREAWT